MSEPCACCGGASYAAFVVPNADLVDNFETADELDAWLRSLSADARAGLIVAIYGQRMTVQEADAWLALRDTRRASVD